MNRCFFCVVAIAGLSTHAGAQEEATQLQLVSYALGQRIGKDFRDNRIQVDPGIVAQGIADALRGAPPKWNNRQLDAAMQQFQRQMQQQQVGRMQTLVVKNRQQEKEFLAKNKTQEGVRVAASGLQYKVIKQGNGASPTLSDTVTCHYRGTLLDGTEFDSSYSRGKPSSFPVGGVIAGWTEALQKMRVGDKWKLFIPSELAYGMNPPGPTIGPASMLVFDIELLGIKGQ